MTGSADPISALLTQGILGVVCVLLLALGRFAYSKIEQTHTRELAAKDAVIAALQADKAALNKAYAEQIKFVQDSAVPAMTRSTDISHEYVELLHRRAIGSGP